MKHHKLRQLKMAVLKVCADLSVQLTHFERIPIKGSETLFVNIVQPKLHEQESATKESIRVCHQILRKIADIPNLESVSNALAVTVGVNVGGETYNATRMTMYMSTLETLTNPSALEVYSEAIDFYSNAVERRVLWEAVQELTDNME